MTSQKSKPQNISSSNYTHRLRVAQAFKKVTHTVFCGNLSELLHCCDELFIPFNRKESGKYPVPVVHSFKEFFPADLEIANK